MNQSNTRPYSFPRFDVTADNSGNVTTIPVECGRWVDAVDAICREAVLQGRIRELERRLTEQRGRRSH